MIDGRWTCYMCAGAYQCVNEDLMQHQLEHKLGRSNDVFYGDSCSEADATCADDWSMLQPFGDYECVLAHEEMNGPLKSSGAVAVEQRSLIHLLPLPIRGRLPTGEDSSSDISV